MARDERWKLQWSGSDERWRPYEQMGPSTDVRVLLDELDRDPGGHFWG